MRLLHQSRNWSTRFLNFETLHLSSKLPPILRNTLSLLGRSGIRDNGGAFGFTLTLNEPANCHVLIYSEHHVTISQGIKPQDVSSLVTSAAYAAASSLTRLQTMRNCALRGPPLFTPLIDKKTLSVATIIRLSDS